MSRCLQYSACTVLFSAYILENTSKHEDIPDARLRSCQISMMKKGFAADV